MVSSFLLELEVVFPSEVNKSFSVVGVIGLVYFCGVDECFLLNCLSILISVAPDTTVVKAFLS